MKTGYAVYWRCLSVVVAVAVGGVVWAQSEAPVAAGQGQASPDLVTLNVDEGQITQVLNAFSRQTGRSIVLGPEVQGKVTARLSNVQWRDALDSILKPYGYGYYMVGETIIIGAVDKIPKAAAGTNVPSTVTSAAMPAPSPEPEPLVVKVFTLKFVDARDVESILRSQLSPRGTVGRLAQQSQSWEEVSVSSKREDSSSENLGRLKRFSERPESIQSKTFVVVDTATVIKHLESIVNDIDKMPTQVQIEARFIEVSAGLLRDVGFEWGTGVDGASSPGVRTISATQGRKLYAAGAQQISGAITPSAFAAKSSGVNATTPINSGMALAFQKLTDFQFEMLIHLLEEDASYNVLSSPRILTMNNQDAIIMVGTKLPIIRSESRSYAGDSGNSSTLATSLDRYEDVGIKLRVLPQVCADEFINLIVHPSVRELVSFQSGRVPTSGENTSVTATDYPVVDTREAETQVLIKSGQTIVIGGMIREKKKNTQLRVPVLGSIPLLGVLFRRDTVSKEKVELLIFLTAKIRDPGDDISVVAPKTAGEGIPEGAKVESKDLKAVEVAAP